jgi:hypothetical protein
MNKIRPYWNKTKGREVYIAALHFHCGVFDTPEEAARAIKVKEAALVALRIIRKHPPNTKPRNDGTCAQCGREFQATRPDHTFCSDVCRQRAYRERKAA